MDSSEVKAFLIECKSLISAGRTDFIPRNYKMPDGSKVRHVEVLLDIGLTNIERAWDEILTLSPHHYFRGPSIDYDRPNDKSQIYEFKKEVNEIIVYIKLKIDNRGCVCMSFHKDW